MADKMIENNQVVIMGEIVSPFTFSHQVFGEGFYRVSELLRTQGLERIPVESAGPGDIVAVAGVNDIMIGETIVDPNDPKPLPLIHVDDPAISMTFGTNDSPLAGTEGKDHKLTARMIKDRLDRELIGNVSIKVLPTDRPDAWEVRSEEHTSELQSH